MSLHNESLVYVESELSRSIERIKLYGETPNVVELLQECLDTLREYDEDGLHDDCPSQDQLDELSSENNDLSHTVEKLEKKLQKRATTALKNQIESLEGKLSDALADCEVYRQRIEVGATPAKLADMFIFTPEEARSQFRVV